MGKRKKKNIEAIHLGLVHAGWDYEYGKGRIWKFVTILVSFCLFADMLLNYMFFLSVAPLVHWSFSSEGTLLEKSHKTFTDYPPMQHLTMYCGSKRYQFHLNFKKSHFRQSSPSAAILQPQLTWFILCCCLIACEQTGRITQFSVYSRVWTRIFECRANGKGS